MDDIKLLKLLHKDPNAGMEQLMNRYAGLLYAVVKGKLAESGCISSDIEDCVADVFSEFYASLDTFDPKISSIKSYLCVMARYHAADILRKCVKDSGNIPIHDEAQCLRLTDHDAEAEDDALRREVLAAVKALGEPDASIMIRKFYLGQSSREIADALHLTVSNVDTRTHRAINKLRIFLGGLEE